MRPKGDIPTAFLNSWCDWNEEISEMRNTVRLGLAPSVSVVIPAMNEAENLPHVLPRIPACVDEVILVDGRSTDNTVAVAHAVYPGIRVVPQHGHAKGA